MHMLLWIKGALSPQEIRNKIIDPTSDFQQKMVEYLESVHIGEFLTGSMQMRKQSRKTDQAVLTSMEIVKLDFQEKYLSRLKLIQKLVL